jgi:dTDP-4-amino-4,6-dideoxygalactose transaminase
MEPLMALARKHNLKVVEDCAQAHGAKLNGKFVGTFGDIGVFSLNANKTIHVGEGGVCVTGDPKLRDRLALIRNHAEAVAEQAGAEPLTNLIGFNFRLTEIAAAMALEQLKKLDRFNRVRWELVQRLNREISRFPFLVPPPSPEGAAYTLYPLRFLPEAAGTSRGEFVRLLQKEGVLFEEGYVRPLYLQPLYQRRQAFKHGYPFTAPVNQGARMEYQRGLCPNAEKLHFEQMLISEIIRPPHGAREIPGLARGIERVAAAMLESVR